MQQRPHSLERQQEMLAKANRQEPLTTYEIGELCMVSRQRVEQVLSAAHGKFRRAFEEECSGGELAELRSVLDQFDSMMREEERAFQHCGEVEY